MQRRDLETSAKLEPARSREAANDHLIRAKKLIGLHRFADSLAAAEATLAIVDNLPDAHLIKVDALLGGNYSTRPSRHPTRRWFGDAGRLDCIGCADLPEWAVVIFPGPFTTTTGPWRSNR